jgi:hypothetical protein
MSSLYNDFNPNPMGKMGDFINQFNQFRSTFSGNPEVQVKQLIQSGRMSQEQFNQLAQTANMLRKMF